MKYCINYLAAFYRTQQLELKEPHLNLSFKHLINAQTQDAFIKEIYREPLAMGDVFCKCIEFHLNEIPSVIKTFGVKPVLTTGYILHNGNALFKFPTSDLKAYLAGEKSIDRLNLHVWLTLPSMEIIDLTLATTLAIVLANYFISHGSLPDFILGTPAALKRESNLIYKPVLVGHHFYEKIGVLPAKGAALLDEAYSH